MAARRRDHQAGESASAARLSRRALLRRLAAFGAAAPLATGLLAACGGSSPGATTTSSSGESTSAAQGTAKISSVGSPQTASGAISTAAASPSAAGTITFQIEPAKHQGGKLIEGTTSDAQTLNSILATDGPSQTVIYLAFEGLMQADPATASPMGSLVKSWEISQDGVTYSFVLHDGVKWHDGELFSANDVKFTYDLALNPAAKSVRYGTLKEHIDSIDIADDTHLSFTLKGSNAAFLVNDCRYGILPQHILREVQPSALAQDPFSTGEKGRTVGTGPFMFEEWVKDDHITLLKNPSYWQGAPNLDQWIYKVVPNATVLTQQLKTGEVDYGGIQPADVADIQKQPNVSVRTYDTFSFNYYAYNLDAAKTTLFQDQAVRQALFYALDRKAMIDAVYFGLAEVAIGTMPAISWAANPDGITLKYPYDPDKAKRLLDGAGWKVGSDGVRAKNGTKLSFSMWSGSSSQTYAQETAIIQQQWKEIGVECTPKTQEWNAFLNRIEHTHDYDIFIVGFGWGVEPDQTRMWACSAYSGGFNLNKYCNPQVDKLLAEGLATTDHAKRKQIYTDMQNIIMDDLPSAVLFFTKSNAGLNKRVHNLFPNAVSDSFNAYQWWVDA